LQKFYTLKLRSLLLIVSPLLLAASCSLSGKESGEKEMEADVLPVMVMQEDDILLEQEYVADIQASQNIELRARVKGYLEKIHVDEGRRVQKGQVLFTIDDDIFVSELEKTKASLQIAEAEARVAELEMRNVKLLVDREVVNKTELELAKAKYDALMARVAECRANVSNATINLSHTVIKAPFDGIIDRIPYKVGSLIDEGTLLTTVSDILTVNAYFNVSENEYLGYMKALIGDSMKTSDRVELILVDGEVYPQKGLIETMEGEIEQGTGTIAFRARFPNPDNLLKHGASGRIRLSRKMDDALLVPQKSTFEVLDRTYVYVTDANGVISQRTIQPEARYGLYYIVRSGLKKGDRVVFEGIQNLKEGDKIIPREVVNPAF
jgi:membrane fusion protein (multidrug efflux system)